MWAAMRRYEGITDDAEAGRLVGESFIPQLEDIPGFVAYYWIDAGDGVMASLSVFGDKDGADKSVELARDWVRENAAELIPNPPSGHRRHRRERHRVVRYRLSRPTKGPGPLRQVFTRPTTGAGRNSSWRVGRSASPTYPERAERPSVGRLQTGSTSATSMRK
jgi:hypothetical protein